MSNAQLAAVRLQAGGRGRLARIATHTKSKSSSGSRAKLQTVATAKSVAQQAVAADAAGDFSQAILFYREALNDIRDNLALAKLLQPQQKESLDARELLKFKDAYLVRVEELQRQTAEHARGLEREQAAAARGVEVAAEGDEARRQLRAQEAE